MNRRPIPWTLAFAIAAGLLLGACDRAPAPAANLPAGATPEAAARAPAAPFAEAEQRFVDHLFAAHVLPASQAFAARGDELLAAAQAFCGARDAARFEALQLAWRDLVHAWQPMRWLQTGPGSEQHRMLRIDAWPQ